jgi:hypothetical protein
MKIIKRIAGLIFPALLSVLISCNKMENSLEQNMYGFTVQNWKAKLIGFPSEDSYAYDEKRKIACVADGVTRDFLDGNAVTYDLKGLTKFLLGKYPEYAKDVADICTKIYLETKSFEFANKSIGFYNQENDLFPTNYLDKDLAGCTVAGVFEDNKKIYWTYIADAGVAIFNKKGDLEFKTKDEGPHSKEKNPHLEEILKNNGGWLSQKGRKIIRSQYRNNPSEPYSYGVLTGEKEALYYLRKGEEKINPGDYVLVFTDGVREIIFRENAEDEINEKFVEILTKGDFKKLEKFCKKKIQTEGSLVVYKVE